MAVYAVGLGEAVEALLGEVRLNSVVAYAGANDLSLDEAHARLSAFVRGLGERRAAAERDEILRAKPADAPRH
jgi:hypothetical protein